MRRRLGILVILLTVAVAPLSAMADDAKIQSYDGRLDDYAQPVTLDSNGTALTYFLFAVLGLICLGAMFRNARRSHLD